MDTDNVYFDDLTVVLPTLNEAGNITRLIHALNNTLPRVKMIVVDDDSKDGTPALVKELMTEIDHLSLIENREKKPCLTKSIMKGVRSSTTDFVAWMDADLSHPPEVLKELYLVSKNENCCCIASRYLKNSTPVNGHTSNIQNDSLLSHFLSKILNFAILKILKLRVSDYTSGFIVLERKLLAHHRFIGDYGEYFIEILSFLERSGITIREIPYTSPPRTSGISKTGTNIFKLVRRGNKYLWMVTRLIFRLRIKP